MFGAAQSSRHLASVLLAALPSIAWAQNRAGSYPDKPVRVVVPFAPGASTDMVDQLNREVNRVLQLPEVKLRFDQLGLDVEGGTPEHFGRFIKSQADAMTALVRAGALQLD